MECLLSACVQVAIFCCCCFHSFCFIFTYLTLPSSHFDVAFLFSIYRCVFSNCIAAAAADNDVAVVVVLFVYSFRLLICTCTSGEYCDQRSCYVLFCLFPCCCFFSLAGESYFHYKHIKSVCVYLFKILKTCDRKQQR